jgi:hypothetical protein
MRFLLALILLTAPVCAFQGVSATEGPLLVRTQAPALGSYGAGGFAELSKPGVPLRLPVILENHSDRELKGTLRVVVIDKWSVEPAGAVPFRLGPREETEREFTLRFGDGTLNALYPVHVYAEFEDQGKKLTAHPVLLLETKIPDLPRPKLPAEWKPVPVPAGGRLGLWRSPVRRERIEIGNTGAEAGRAGREVAEEGSVLTYGGLGDAREGIGMTLGARPPAKREMVESAAVEYALALPAVKPVRLETAIRGNAAFTVEVAPFAGGAAYTTEWQKQGTTDWTPASVNLDRYAGTAVRLSLGVRGEKGEAQWSAPAVAAGAAPQAAAFPPPQLGAKLLGKAGGCEVRLGAGARGLLDAPLGLDCGGRKLYARGFRVRVAGDDLEQWASSTDLVEAKQEASDGGVRVRHRFRNWAGTFDVMGEVRVKGEALRARFWLENAPPHKPWFQVTLEAVSFGAWSERAKRVYAGPGNVIENPKAFRMGFDGHNLATSFIGLDFAGGISVVMNNTAIPDRLEVDPETKIYSLVTPHAQTLELFPAENVFSAVKRIRDEDPRQAAGGVKTLAGRFVFDLWSGRYAESAQALERVAEYGVTDALVVWHVWQRWGYDYRLPDIYPPNPEYGTLEEFQSLAAACKRQGTLFAPHDNYIDFYPDFEGFTYDSIAFRQNGTPYKAWFNYGREAQSFRARPDKLMPYVERNARLLKEGVAATAYFIDVWSSIAPYDFWTIDGKFVERQTTQRAWGEAFAWIRNELGGAPQISEAGHDKLIGWLDGAQAQQLRVDPKGQGFTWRIECGDAERIPWIDVAWHDKFVLHGAGYEDRYLAGLDRKTHGSYSDDYLSTQVLSGRPAMVPEAFSRDVVRVHWLLNDAMKALALDRIEAVEFGGNDIHRQHVRWGRGEVWVNRGPQPWMVAGHTLPQYGFYVKAGGVEAAVETKDGKRVEWSRAPEWAYENGQRRSVSGRVMTLPE